MSGYYDEHGEYNLGDDGLFPCTGQCDKRMSDPGETCRECFRATHCSSCEIPYEGEGICPACVEADEYDAMIELAAFTPGWAFGV